MADDKDLKEIDIAPSTLEDVDTATYNWLNEQLDVKTRTNKGFRKVPVQWVAGEKAFQMKSNPSLRDSSGALIMPMITIERSSVIKDPARKGTAYGNIPNRGDNKGGAITVARRIKQDKTGNFSNAKSRKKTGKLNFRTRKQEKVVYETITIPMPVYVEVTYSISLRAEYQQQMNDMVQPFITEPGGTNYLTVQNNNHSYEAFMESDFTLENTVSDMQGERSYETKIQLKVLAPLIGDGVNQETPKYVVRENAVDVKILREVSTLDSNYVPRRLTTPSVAGSFDITADAAAAALPDVEMFVSPETITTEETGSSQFLGVRFNRNPEVGTVRVDIVEQLDATEHEVDTAFLEFENNFTQQKFFKFTGKPDTVQDADFTTEITIRATSVDDVDFLLEKKVTLINKNLELFDVPQDVLIITEDATQTPSVSVPFKLNFQPPQDVTLTLTALPGLDERYTVGAQSLTFTTQNWNEEQSFTFTAIDDNFVNGNADFTLTVSSGTQDKNFTIQVVDNDTASMTVEPTEVITSEDVNSDMNEATINVVLGASPAVGETVTISFSGLEPDEHSADTVQFTSDDWNQQKPITITGLPDGVQDNDQTYVAQLVSQSTNPQSTFHNMSVDVTLTNLDTDVEAGLILTSDSGEISEEGTTFVTTTMSLKSAPQNGETITITLTDDSDALSGLNVDYEVEIDGVAIVDSFTFSDNTEKEIKFIAIQDDVQEINPELFAITLTSSSDDVNSPYNEPFVETYNLRVNDNDEARINLSSDGDTIIEGETITIQVSLNSQPVGGETVTINVTQQNLEAGQGLDSDYELTTSSVSFDDTDWNLPKTVQIINTTDNIAEQEETFTLNFDSSSNIGDSPYHQDSGLTKPFTFTIQDTNTAGILMKDVNGTTSGTTLEEGTSTSFTIELTSQPTSNVTLNIEHLNGGLGTEYTFSQAQAIVFTSENWNQPVTINIEAIDDSIDENEEVYSIKFTVTEDSAEEYLNKEKTFTLTIGSDSADSAGIVATLSPDVLQEGDTPTKLTVRLNSQPDENETVTITLSGDSLDTDYEVVGGNLQLSFDDTNWNSQDENFGFYSIEIVDDSLLEGQEDFTITLTAESNLDSSPFNNQTAQVTLTITDNEEAGVILLSTSDEVLEGDATQFDISEDGTTASFKLRLASQPSDEVTLSFTDNPAGIGTEYNIEIDDILLVGNSITFQPAEWNTPRVIKLVAIDDSLVEDVETFTLTMTADGGGFQNVSRSVIVSITSDDTAGIQINNKPDFIDLDESNTAATVSVSVQLTSPPAADETVTLSVAPPSDDFSTTQVVFTADNWDNAQDIIFTVTDDAVVEVQETFQVKIEASSSLQDSAFAGLESEELTVRITDNDTRGIELADVSEQTIAGVPTVALNEFEDGDVNEIINVRLTSQPTGQVTLDIADTNGDGVIGEEFAVMINSTLNESTQVVFDETNWNQFQQIIFSAIDDDDLEGDEQYSLMITASGADYEGEGIQREVTVTMEDVETIEIIATPLAVTTSEEETSGTIQISLSHAALTDDVTIVIDDINSAEHIASPETVTFTSDDDVTTQKTIQFTGVADPDGLDDADVSYQITLRTVSDDVRFNGKTKVVQLTNTDISPQVPATQFRFTGLEVQQFGSNIGEDTVFVFDVEGMDDSNFDTLMNYTADTFQMFSATHTQSPLRAGNGDFTASYNQDFSKFTVTIPTNRTPLVSGKSASNNFVGWHAFTACFGALSSTRQRYVHFNFRVHPQTFEVLNSPDGTIDFGSIVNSPNGYIFSPPKIDGASTADSFVTNFTWRRSTGNGSRANQGIKIDLPLEDYQFVESPTGTITGLRNHFLDKAAGFGEVGYFGMGIAKYKKDGVWKFINAAQIDDTHYLHGDMTADNAVEAPLASLNSTKVFVNIATTPILSLGWFRFSNANSVSGGTTQETPDADSEIIVYFPPFASSTTAIHDILLSSPQLQYAGNIAFATDIKIVMNTSDLSYQIFRNSNVGATPNWVAVEDCYLSNQKVLP